MTRASFFATVRIDAAFLLDTRLYTYVRILLSYLSVRSSSSSFFYKHHFRGRFDVFLSARLPSILLFGLIELFLSVCSAFSSH